MLPVLGNSLGLLFGFGRMSDVCVDLRLNQRTNFEYYTLPIAPYACKPGAGILEPGTEKLFHWFGETKK